MSVRHVTLVGDGIENPGNVQVLARAAAMFGADCRIRPAGEAAEMPGDAQAAPEPIEADALTALHARRIAFDNLPRAADVYGYRPGDDFAVMVGNERRGLSHSLRSVATEAVQIPMHSRRINTLNVAAAAAVALYYLCQAPVRPIAARSHLDARRPSLLLLGAGRHIELGSAIRSAAAFGWERAFVEDRDGVWFGVDRVTRSEGRAAARRARNAIRLLPCAADTRHLAQQAVVVSTRLGGVPLPKVDLARGPRQLLVLPDESRIDLEAEDWRRLADEVVFARLDLPGAGCGEHFRLPATIALAEAARQVGLRTAGRPVRGERRSGYRFALPAGVTGGGEVLTLDELMDY